jgi:hypothetical protein
MSRKVNPSWCLFSRLQVIEFGLPLVEAPSAYTQFFRQIANVVATSHPLDSHPLKLPRVSLPLHFAVLSLTQTKKETVGKSKAALWICSSG